jgi:hypothetical protein
MKIIKSLQISAAALALMLTVVSNTAAAYSPARPTYTWNKTAKDVTFNSITNNPAVGDERSFLVVRNLGNNDYKDQLKVSDNEEVVLRIYYHNDAASNKIAKKTNVQVILPAYTAKSMDISAFISADNAKPGTVADTANLNADQPFKLEYEKGSAQIWNNALRGNKLPDTIVTQQKGALIGYDKLDGNVAGGSKYSGYVTLKVKVHISPTVVSTGSVGVVNGIPNTGPGEVLGLFASASAVGTAAHMVVSRRNRQ